MHPHIAIERVFANDWHKHLGAIAFFNRLHWKLILFARERIVHVFVR